MTDMVYARRNCAHARTMMFVSQRFMSTQFTVGLLSQRKELLIYSLEATEVEDATIIIVPK